MILRNGMHRSIRRRSTTVVISIAAALAVLGTGPVAADDVTVNCPTETTKSVARGGGLVAFHLGSNDSCYCYSQAAGVTASDRVDELTDTADAQSVLDHMLANTIPSNVTLFEERAQMSFSAWLASKGGTSPTAINPDKIVTLRIDHTRSLHTYSAFRFDSDEMISIHQSFQANAQRVVDLYNFKTGNQ